MFDPANMFRTTADGDLTADETLPDPNGLDMHGPDLVPMVIQVHVPEIADPADTLDIKLQVSDDDVTYVDHTVLPQITAAGEFYITSKVKQRYRKLVLDVTGLAVDFGAVEAGYVPAGEYENW